MILRDGKESLLDHYLQIQYFENVEKVAQATAEFVKEERWPWEKGVFIGYDTRFMSELFAQKVAEILAANDIKVIFPKKFVPTPFVTFGIIRYGLGFGISITASHNPYQYNGYKLRTPEGGAAPPEITVKIEERIGKNPARAMDFSEAIRRGVVEVINPYPDYIAWVKKRIDLEAIGKAEFEIIANPMHGATADLSKTILEPYGCSVEVINLKREGFFGFKHPEPIEKNVLDLIALIKEKKANVGIATDGDGDRVGLVDEKGNFVNPHQIYSLILMHLVKNRKLRGNIAKTVSTTSLLNKIAQDFGLKVIETGVGFKFMAKLLAEKEVIIGGEESGGIGVIFHIPERDGLFSALLVLEYMAYEGKTLSELVEMLWDRYGKHIYKREDVRVNVIEEAQNFVKELKNAPPERIGGRQVKEIITTDGVKFVLEDGSWMLFRASGTEPLLRVYCESFSQEELKEILEDGKKLVGQYLQR